MSTQIEWAMNPDGSRGEVWNPVTGCQKVSQGCKNCYAERIASRFWGERKFTDVRIHPERLEEPLHWTKPRRVFVNSMSDLFHEAVYDNRESFLDEIFAIMAATPHHTYMVLTKRPVIMRNYLSNPRRDEYIEHSLETIYGEHGWCSPNFDWPLPNVWIGVSVEDQKAADDRIPFLLEAPAAVKFVSCEPLLGPVHLGMLFDDNPYMVQHGIDWVIAGGESGPGARPCHPDWIRSIRDQCQQAATPFFFKQWGEWGEDDSGKSEAIRPDGKRSNIGIELMAGAAKMNGYTLMARMGKKSSGSLLDGREWKEFPEVKA